MFGEMLIANRWQPARHQGLRLDRLRSEKQALGDTGSAAMRPCFSSLSRFLWPLAKGVRPRRLPGPFCLGPGQLALQDSSSRGGLESIGSGRGVPRCWRRRRFEPRAGFGVSQVDETGIQGLCGNRVVSVAQSLIGRWLKTASAPTRKADPKQPSTDIPRATRYRPPSVRGRA